MASDAELSFNINEADMWGSTPLMTACKRGAHEVVAYLLGHGTTAWVGAWRVGRELCGMVEVAAVGRSPPAYFFYGTFAGADVNKQDVHLQTALSICVKRLNKCVATPGK